VELGRDYTHPHWTQQLLPLGTFIQRHILETSDVTGYLAQHSLFIQVRKLPENYFPPKQLKIFILDSTVDGRFADPRLLLINARHEHMAGSKRHSLPNAP
jgi:hypothetical protein